MVIDQAIGIIAGRNGVAESQASDTDEQLVPVGAIVAYGTAVVGPGTDNILTTSLAGDDLYESINSIPPATDPTQRDTDRDAICLLYTSPSPRDQRGSRMPSSA